MSERNVSRGRQGTFDPYVPRLVLDRLVHAPAERVQVVDATVMFADVSGFTRLSERLAKTGREGAELLVDAINLCWSALLSDARIAGGSLLKFGGDALLIWFDGDGHAARACRTAFAMRRTLRDVGRVRAGGAEVTLRMSIGVHSGAFHAFLVGGSHREFLVAGPASTKVVAMEARAGAGQILVSPQTAARLPARVCGRALGPGVLLARQPDAVPPPEPLLIRPLASDDEVAQCLPTAIRAYVRAASNGSTPIPEHRTVTSAFLQFQGLDSLIEADGDEAAADAIDEVVRLAQDAADGYEVALLESDVAADGGKLLLSAGAPRAVGDDEERMLLALRKIISGRPRLPIKLGVNRGPVFTCEVGTADRRTYVAMGDTTNLAARLCGRAPPGWIYATKAVLDRSRTKFDATPLEPVQLKGKARPVQPWHVGPARRAGAPAGAAERIPLVGRERELQTIRDAVAAAAHGTGTLIEIVGDTGLGKSRLLREARQLADDLRIVHATCETYTQETPYTTSRDILRQVLELGWDDADDVVLERVASEVRHYCDELLPWLPLIAMALGAQQSQTREVRQLASDARTAKLHEVVISFLERALKVPTLVQVEHGHMMDAASSGLLHAIARALPNSAWVVLVTRAEHEQGFVADPSAGTRLELGPLARQDAMTLAESTAYAQSLPPHALAIAVERSGGSPEFLLDLLAASHGATEQLPDSLEAAATARIDALDPGDRRLVRTAALLGLSFHPRRLEEVLDGGAAPSEATWTRLEGVFARDPGGYLRFRRPALREVAYAGLPFRLRRELHARAGRSLERDLGRDPDAEPAVLSLHFLLGGDDERAWRYAMMGARQAALQFANADAARLYRRAIEAGRAGGVTGAELAGAWEARGEALRRVGEPQAASEAFTAARRLLPGRPVDQGRLFLRHAVTADVSGGIRSAVRWANRGLRTLDGADDEDARALRARLLSELAGFRQRQGRPVEAERFARQAIAAAEAIGDLRAEARASQALDWALFENGQHKDFRYSERALEIYQLIGDPEEEARVLLNMGGMSYWAGRWDEAVEFYRCQATARQRAGQPAKVAYTDLNVGEVLSDQGHLDEAETHLHRARRVCRATGDELGVAFADLQLGRIATRRQQGTRAIELLTQGEAQLRQAGLDRYVELATSLIAEAYAFNGEPEKALEFAGRLLAAGDRQAPLLHRARGLALATLGRTDEAASALEQSLDAARNQDAVYDIAATLDALELVLGPHPERATERDAIVARLGIRELPRAAVLLPSG